MTDIVNLMQKQPDFYAMKGASVEEISRAEKELTLRFADDYRRYVAAFGVASYSGHELTGVCKSKRLNVVNVTLEERSKNAGIPSDWYVIEQANIDGIVIWQTMTGEVYQSMPNATPKKLCNSLCEFVHM